MLYSVVEKHSTIYPYLALLPRIRSASTYPHLALLPRIRGASSCRANRFTINTGDCDVYHVTSIVGFIRRIAKTVTYSCTHEIFLLWYSYLIFVTHEFFLLWYSDLIFVMNGFDVDRVRVFVSSAAPPYSVRLSGGSERQALRASSTSGLPSRFQNTGVPFQDHLAAPPACFILARIAVKMRALNFRFMRVPGPLPPASPSSSPSASQLLVSSSDLPIPPPPTGAGQTGRKEASLDRSSGGEEVLDVLRPLASLRMSLFRPELLPLSVTALMPLELLPGRLPGWLLSAPPVGVPVALARV